MEKFYSHDLQCEVQQIQKRTARRLFNEGKTIYLLACYLRFDNMWSKPMPTDRKSSGGLSTFDQICRDYEAYRCCYELGYYPRFYIKVTDLQN